MVVLEDLSGRTQIWLENYSGLPHFPPVGSCSYFIVIAMFVLMFTFRWLVKAKIIKLKGVIVDSFQYCC